MYCTNCGKELSGGEFCTNCGKKIDSSVNNQVPNYNNAMYTAPSPAKKPINKTTVFAVVGGVAALLLIILVFTHGKSNDNNTIPYYGDPYTDTQGINPPAGYSNGYSGYSDYDTYDSYDYSNNSQICPSCYGSGTCPICNGTGQYSMYGNDYSECSACGGTGVCSVCGGAGVF